MYKNRKKLFSKVYSLNLHLCKETANMLEQSDLLKKTSVTITVANSHPKTVEIEVIF